MKTNSFSFELPEELIAQHPPKERGGSRLLSLDRKTGSIEHYTMKEFPSLIPENALIVFNDTRVRKVRLIAERIPGGGKTEIFLLKFLGDKRWECMVSKSKKQHVGQRYVLPEDVEAEIIDITEDNHRIISFNKDVDDTYLDQYGHIPLPPYIKREDEKEDEDRYQTIFAKETGSAAAPTASLHFTPKIMEQLKKKNIQWEFITLHVGLGTFAPVRSENILEHKMHREEFYISKKTALAIENAKKQGRPILAVGTTSVRALESAWIDQKIKQGWQDTDIFIYPGYDFKVVTQMFTNFHTPESTLLMLVSAFAGRDNIFQAYLEAIDKKYRFFSYGDAMIIQ